VVTPQILVADDDEAICDTVEDALHLAGYATLRARNGEEALDQTRKHRPSLIILDVNMPKLNGFDVANKLNALKIDIPIIFLTARHSREDVVSGLKIGADDYIKKPFGIEELLLRVSAVLRRVSPEIDKSLECGPISLNAAKHEVLCAERNIKLSPTEFKLLEYFMENQNRVLTKQQVLDAVWGIDFESNTSVVETFVSYLRRKLAPEIEKMLLTERGIGFKLVTPK
jgi:two-component system OmpR family response regulator